MTLILTHVHFRGYWTESVHFHVLKYILYTLKQVKTHDSECLFFSNSNKISFSVLAWICKKVYVASTFIPHLVSCSRSPGAGWNRLRDTRWPTFKTWWKKPWYIGDVWESAHFRWAPVAAQKIWKLRIWSHLLKKSIMKNFILCAVCWHNIKTNISRL